jgi:hypothetical protein
MSAAKASLEAPFGSPDSVMRSVQASMANMMIVPQKVVEANLETGAELLRFISRRLKSQSELWSQVGHCHGVDEAAEAQRTFVDKLNKDYAEEMGHLATMFRKNLETVTGAVTDQLRQAGVQGNAGTAKH